jgi:hypothetical protein
MVIKELRKELNEARTAVQSGRQDDAVVHIDHILEDLSDERLLTTNQARELLGIGSVNTLKLLVKKTRLNVEYHGNRMMIPVGELERLQESALVHGIRTSDHLHAESAGLGGEGLSPEELSLLEESRPGSLPWSETVAAAGA